MNENEPLLWVKSTFCESGSCVEAAFNGDRVLVRDSKDEDGPQLSFTHAEWGAFLAGARNGEFRNG